MSNTSVDISAVTLNFFNCTKQVYVGFVWTYIGVILCFFLGTPAHFWFFWLSVRAGRKFKPTQVFPINLRAMDLLFCFHLCVEIINIFILQNTQLTFVTHFTYGLSWGCRLLIQVCICVEQYLAVLYPITFLRYKSARYRIVLAAVSWSMSFAYGLLLAFEEVQFPDNIFLVACFFGVVVISFCCVSILRVLKHPSPGETEIPMERSRDVGNQQKRNAFKTIVNVLLIVLVSYLPMAFISIAKLFPVDRRIFLCDIVLAMISFHVYCVLISPLLKLYNDGHLKCIFQVKLM